jgi:hypothetical protein
LFKLNFSKENSIKITKISKNYLKKPSQKIMKIIEILSIKKPFFSFINRRIFKNLKIKIIKLYRNIYSVKKKKKTLKTYL